MSLFDGTGSDIWSIGAFPEESSLKDLLDGGVYTLEQLLCEDELLQELKGLHPQLVAYLSKPQICRELIAYMTCTSDQKSLSEEDDLNLSLRFPYMACEVICCEISGIVDTIADGYIDDETTVLDESSSAGAQEFDSLASNDGSTDGFGISLSESRSPETKLGRMRLLDSLFDLSLVVTKRKPTTDRNEPVDNDGEGNYVVDDRLAGYLEKVLSVLFRLRPSTLSAYLNQHGSKLLPLFFHHISSYSVTQILQRLLLPIDNNTNNYGYDNNEDVIPTMADPRINSWINDDETFNLLLQQIVSPTFNENSKSLDEVTHCAEILISLLQSSSSPLERLLDSDRFCQILFPLTQIPDPFTPNESRLTHVLHLLEAMLLQLGGYGMHSVPSKQLKLSIITFLPKIIKVLRNILIHPSTKNWKMENQLKLTISQCGVPRLRAVRVLEALVLLGEEEIDEVLVAKENGRGDIIGLACDLFWEMEWCSGLHQSVANMIVHVLEGQNRRHFMQNYLINEYNLVEKLLDAFDRNEQNFKKYHFRLGYMGHVIIMCQALDHILNSKDEPTLDTKAEDEDEVLDSRSVDDVSDVDISVPSSNGDESENSMDLIDDDVVESSLVRQIEDLTVSDVEKTENGDSINTSHSSQSEQNDAENVVDSPSSNDDIDINSFTLVGQAISTPLPNADKDEIDNNLKEEPVDSTNIPTQMSASVENHSSSKLINYLQSHSVHDRWSGFVTTVLHGIGELQSTPLGGTGADQYGNYGIGGQGSAFDDFDDTDHDIGEGSLNITENELDIAASMMEALSNGGVSKDGNGHSDYLYDDPLGRRPDDDDFGTEEDQKGDSFDEDDDNNDDSDVQVLDLFVRNYDSNNDDAEKDKQSDEEPDDSDDENDNTDEKTMQNKEIVDASWTNFADFESVPVERFPDSQFSAPQEDFFANFGDSSNDTAECFFDADFSNFSSSNVTDSTMGNGIVSESANQNMEEVTKNNSNVDVDSSSQAKPEINVVGNLFTDQAVKLYAKDVDVASSPEEDNDPFSEFARQRRPSIDELF